jgi:hypothetical protein
VGIDNLNIIINLNELISLDTQVCIRGKKRDSDSKIAIPNAGEFPHKKSVIFLIERPMKMGLSITGKIT